MLSELAGLGTGICLGVASLYLRMAVRSESIPKVIWFVAAFGAITLSPWAISALRDFVGNEGSTVAITSGLLYFLAAGLIGQVIGRSFLYACIDQIGPSLATAYKTAVPLLTAIFAWLIFHERLAGATVLGIAAVVVGILFIALYQPKRSSAHASSAGDAEAESAVSREIEPVITHTENSSNQTAGRRGPAAALTSRLPAGLALGLGAVIFYSASDLLRKGGMDALPSPTVGTWVGNVLTLAVFSAQFGLQRRLVHLIRWNLEALRPLLTASILVTVAYILFLIGIETSGVAITSALAAVEPLAALAVGKAFYRDQEPIQSRQIPGVLFVVAGVALIVLS